MIILFIKVVCMRLWVKLWAPDLAAVSWVGVEAEEEVEEHQKQRSLLSNNYKSREMYRLSYFYNKKK